MADTNDALIEKLLGVWLEPVEIRSEHPMHTRMAAVVAEVRAHDARMLATIMARSPNATSKRVPAQIVVCDTAGLLALSNDGFIYQAEWDGTGYKWMYRVNDLPQG